MTVDNSHRHNPQPYSRERFTELCMVVKTLVKEGVIPQSEVDFHPKEKKRAFLFFKKTVRGINYEGTLSNISKMRLRDVVQIYISREDTHPSPAFLFFRIDSIYQINRISREAFHKFMLKQKFHPGPKDQKRLKTALDCATKRLDYLAIKFLLKNGAHPDGSQTERSEQDDSQLDVLGRALCKKIDKWKSGRAYLSQYITRKNCGGSSTRSYFDPRFYSILNGCSPIHFASASGRIDIIQLLLRNGAQINQLSEDRCTPLWFATFGGNIETVRFLLERGADCKIDSVHGGSPKYHAYIYGTDTMAEFLESQSTSSNSRWVFFGGK